MVGISKYGAYVPVYRMGKGTEAWTARGERAVTSFDEDSITMAVAAGMDCLGDADTNKIDALYFASTTSPYKEKLAATVVAKALALRPDAFTVDFAGSLRSGTAALKAAVDAVKAGSAKNILVTIADQRTPQPRSGEDETFGDGAAAFLVSATGVIATIDDVASVFEEIYDVWRIDGDVFPRTSEDRFIAEEGYFKATKAAATAVMARNKLSPKDFAQLIVYANTARRQTEMCKNLSFDDKTQMAPAFFGTVGDTGTALVPMMLAALLEKAKAGQKVLVVSYGQGSDAMIITATKDGAKPAGTHGMSGYMASKRLLPSYLTYLRWRNLVSVAPPAKRPPLKIPGMAALWREGNRNISLIGCKCKKCGTIQYPEERVCTQCQAQDQMEPYKMSRKAHLFTHANDYLGPVPDSPMVLSVVDFDGGGRGMFMMTDRDINQIKIGMPLEMSFRRLHTVEGIHNYFWCAIPARS